MGFSRGLSRALPLAHARERAPSLPVYVCTLLFFSPESLISALSLYLVCVCARVCVRALPVFSGCLTLVPHSGSVPISQTLASTCTLSLLCQSVLLSPPLLLLPSRPPTRGQLLRLSFPLSLLSPAHFLRGCVHARLCVSPSFSGSRPCLLPSLSDALSFLCLCQSLSLSLASACASASSPDAVLSPHFSPTVYFPDNLRGSSVHLFSITR